MLKQKTFETFLKKSQFLFLSFLDGATWIKLLFSIKLNFNVSLILLELFNVNSGIYSHWHDVSTIYE